MPLTQCPSCGESFRGNPPACPECGIELFESDPDEDDCPDREVRACAYCHEQVTYLDGGIWVAGDGTAACPAAPGPFIPHKPKGA